MKKFFLAAVVLALLFLISTQPKIFIGTENQTVAVVNAEENLPLSISFIHSVQKTPVIEELEYRDGEFVLIRTKYKSQGVGLPFDEEADGKFYRDEDWFVMDNMNRRFKSLELRTGKGTKLTVNLDGKNYELYKIFPVGTKIFIRKF